MCNRAAAQLLLDLLATVAALGAHRFDGLDQRGVINVGQVSLAGRSLRYRHRRRPEAAAAT